jgi:gamma-glutamyltranspeptidase/glutathione hydrolase
VAALAALSLLSGCGHLLGGSSANASLGQTATTRTVFGYATADEPQAALAARQILNQGGNAADAAAAAGFVLSVTLPSRAGLGGGGACIVKMPDAHGNAQPPVALLFPARAPATLSGSRPAAVPGLARGLLALQARYGVLPAASVIVPAERLAGGAPVSPALESDLQVVGNALAADPAAAAIFAPGGVLLPEGADLVQPDLAATLESLRVLGVQGLYAGSYAQKFAAAADQAGAGLKASDLVASAPQFAAPSFSASGGLTTAALPNPAPGSLQPATASFSALDKNGGVVSCAVTMNNLFGTGRVAPGTGILLAAPPRASQPAILAASVTYTSNGTFRATTTGTGQGAVSRANAIACPGGVPGGEASCTATADPHGQGLAIGGR